MADFSDVANLTSDGVLTTASIFGAADMGTLSGDGSLTLAGLSARTATATFSGRGSLATSFPAPMRPMVRAVPNLDGGYTDVWIFNAVTADYPVTSNILFRSADGINWQRLAENIPVSGHFTDYTAPVAGDVYYAVLAVYTGGPTYAMSVITNVHIDPEACGEYIWVSGGPAFTWRARFRGKPEESTDHAKEGTLEKTLADTDPWFYPGHSINHEVSFSGILEEGTDPLSTEAAFTKLQDWEGTCLLRDAHGRQVFGSLGAVEFGQLPYGLKTISAKLTQTYLTGLDPFRWNTDKPLPPPLTSVQIIIILNQYPNSGAWGLIPTLPEFAGWINPNAFSLNDGSMIGWDGTSWGPYDPNAYNDPYDPATVMGTSTSPTSCIDGTTNLPAPGTTFYMPVPAFYPGETNNWGTKIDGNYADTSTPDDGTFATPTSGQRMITGGGLNNAGYFTPTPILDKAYWAIRVRGTGTFTIQTGCETNGSWDWYYTGPDTITNWSAATSINIASTDWVDRAFPIPTGDLAGASNMYTFCNLIQVTSGSLDFDFIEFRAAGDCGYCKLTGNTSFGPWHSIAPATVNLYADYTTIDAQYNQPDLGITDFGTSTNPADAQGTYKPTIDADVNMLYGIPAAPAGTSPTDGSGYSQYNGRYYPSIGSSISKPQWWFDPYYAGAGGIPPHDATAGWAFKGNTDPADPSLRTKLHVQYNKFNPGYISKPTAPPEVVSGLIRSINYDNVYYDTTTTTQLLMWVLQAASAGSGKGFIASNQDPVENDFTVEARLNTTWVPGQPLPGPTDGTVIDTATFHGAAGMATTPNDTAVTGGDLTSATAFSIWVRSTSGECTLAGYNADLRMRVQYPQAHARLLEWKYLGG